MGAMPHCTSIDRDVVLRSTPVVQARSLARVDVAGDTGLMVCCSRGALL
jgi:hypothetical protein